jgi:hypothetical protein
MNSIINSFFDQVKTIDDGQNFLKFYKNFVIYPYNQITSRKILFSLMLYKFPEDHYCADLLKELSRSIILSILRNESIDIYVPEYVKAFDEWKSNDYNNTIFELSANFFTLQEIKNDIIKNITSDVDKEWIHEIDILQNKLLTYISKLKGNSLHEKFINDLNNKKQEKIFNIFDEIYWNNFENQLKNNDLTLLLSNFNDMKIKLLEIHNDQDTQEFFDSDLLYQSIISNNFNSSSLISIINFVSRKLLTYGVPSCDSIVIKEKNNLIDLINQSGLNEKIISQTFKILFKLIMNLLQILKTYRNIY